MNQYKQIKFEHQLAQDIEKGKQTATFRFFDEKHIGVGDVLEVVDKVERDNPASWMFVGFINVLEVIEKRVQDLESKDYGGHEQYDSIKSFLKTFSYFYAKEIDMLTPVKNYSF